MGTNFVFKFTRMLYILFFIGTIITIFIVYKDITNSISIRFLWGYAFFSFFLILYIPIVTIINSRKLKWLDIRKRLIISIVLFIIFGVSNYLLDYVLRPSKIDLLREFSTAFGLAFGGSFFDVIFLKKKNDVDKNK